MKRKIEGETRFLVLNGPVKVTKIDFDGATVGAQVTADGMKARIGDFLVEFEGDKSILPAAEIDGVPWHWMTETEEIPELTTEDEFDE